MIEEQNRGSESANRRLVLHFLDDITTAIPLDEAFTVTVDLLQEYDRTIVFLHSSYKSRPNSPNDPIATLGNPEN